MNNINIQKLTDDITVALTCCDYILLGHYLALPHPEYSTYGRHRPGDIRELRSHDGVFEGYVELLELESWATSLEDDYEIFDRDPVGYRNERWLVRWCSQVWADNLKREGKMEEWFTQAAMAGKMGHRIFSSPTRGLLNEERGDQDYFHVKL